MHACDVIITKAGPGTIAESFICGLPVLLNGYIPGQEEGNIDYVLEHKVCTLFSGHDHSACLITETSSPPRPPPPLAGLLRAACIALMHSVQHSSAEFILYGRYWAVQEALGSLAPGLCGACQPHMGAAVAMLAGGARPSVNQGQRCCTQAT